MLTPSPRMSSPSIRMSPRLIPILNSIRRSVGTPSFLWAITACTATAHSTASTTEGNSSSTPSPVVLTMRPPCFATSASVTAGVRGGCGRCRPHQRPSAGNNRRHQPPAPPPIFALPARRSQGSAHLHPMLQYQSIGVAFLPEHLEPDYSGKGFFALFANMQRLIPSFKPPHAAGAAAAP
jgi:hypothetical protein